MNFKLVAKTLHKDDEKHSEWMKMVALMKRYHLHHHQINSSFSLYFYWFRLSYLKSISCIFLCPWFLDICHQRVLFRRRGMLCVSIKFDVSLRVRLSAVFCQQPLKNTKIIQYLRYFPQPPPKPLFFWNCPIYPRILRWNCRVILRFGT